ncbi:MAG TPA: hypothetical protein VF911_21780 [Thermoanaerobaculia bacterium]
MIHVLVTDGVQSTGQSSSGGGTNCDTGADQACVRNALTRWLSSGWSGSLIGLRSEFRGTIFSEVNRDNPGRPRAHRYESTPGVSATFRPFYLYVLSPDAAALEEFIRIFKRRLRGEAPTTVLRELPLHGRYTTSAAATLTSMRTGSQIISVERGTAAAPERVTIRFEQRDAHETIAGPVTFGIRPRWSANALDMASPRELARLLTWEVVPLDVPSGKSKGRLPELRILFTTARDDGSIDVQVTPVWPAGTRKKVWAFYAVRARMSLNEDTPGWIREWSTNLDDSPEYGNRTLFLENAALGIWRRRDREPEVVAQILVRLGP